MEKIPEARLGTDLPELGPIDELLLGLIEAGCQYLRDHPEARSEIRRHAARSLRRALLERELLEQLEDDDADAEARS